MSRTVRLGTLYNEAFGPPDTLDAVVRKIKYFFGIASSRSGKSGRSHGRTHVSTTSTTTTTTTTTTTASSSSSSSSSAKNGEGEAETDQRLSAEALRQRFEVVVNGWFGDLSKHILVKVKLSSLLFPHNHGATKSKLNNTENDIINRETILTLTVESAFSGVEIISAVEVPAGTMIRDIKKLIASRDVRSRYLSEVRLFLGYDTNVPLPNESTLIERLPAQSTQRYIKLTMTSEPTLLYCCVQGQPQQLHHMEQVMSTLVRSGRKHKHYPGGIFTLDFTDMARLNHDVQNITRGAAYVGFRNIYTAWDHAIEYFQALKGKLWLLCLQNVTAETLQSIPVMRRLKTLTHGHVLMSTLEWSLLVTEDILYIDIYDPDAS